MRKTLSWIIRKCPVCGAHKTKTLVNLPVKSFCDVNFAYRKNYLSLLGFKKDMLFPIVRCDYCGFVYSQFLLDPKLLNSVYEKVIDPKECFAASTSPETVRHNVKKWHTLLSTFGLIEFKEQNIKVLDFGAGWGTFLEVARAPHIAVFGYETSSTRLAYMKKKGIKVLRDYVEIKEAGQYHLICCNQVLEHVPNPLIELRNIKNVLDNDGLAYLSVPNYSENRLGKQLSAFRSGKDLPKELNPWEHLNYFTPESFRYLISATGLKIVRYVMRPELMNLDLRLQKLISDKRGAIEVIVARR